MKKIYEVILAVAEGHAQALLGASVFHFGILTIRQVKEYLWAHGVAVRLPGLSNACHCENLSCDGHDGWLTEIERRVHAETR